MITVSTFFHVLCRTVVIDTIWFTHFRFLHWYRLWIWKSKLNAYLISWQELTKNLFSPLSFHVNCQKKFMTHVHAKWTYVFGVDLVEVVLNSAVVWLVFLFPSAALQFPAGSTKHFILKREQEHNTWILVSWGERASSSQPGWVCWGRRAARSPEWSSSPPGCSTVSSWLHAERWECRRRSSAAAPSPGYKLEQKHTDEL